MEKLIRKLILLTTFGRVPVSPPKKRVETRVPQVAHFVFGLWSDGPLPSHFQRTIDNWEKQGWAVRLWRRDDVEQLLTSYPEVKAVYDNVPRDVQRADLARYAIIHDQGGFYMDCDCGPKHFSLLHWLQKKKDALAFFFVEEILTKEIIAFRNQHPMREKIPEVHQEKICNYFFGAEAGNATVKACLDEAVRRCQLFPEKDIDDLGVLTTTGPEVTTDVVQASRSDVMVRHNEYFCDHGRTGTWRED